MVDELIGGRYRLVARHAVGGMASLWRARDERTGETVALKRLHPFLVADPRARSRLVREAAALKAIDHPAITRPRDLIEDPDDPALVMEFAEGRSLKDRLAAEGALDPEEATAIAATVADALAVAHDAGIVHRDIKPGNILVEDSGAVHLVDFGIATVADDDASDLTATGTIVGTVRYAAPERLMGDDPTPRSDVWGLGAVLYEMVTGRPAIPDGESGARAMPGEGRLPPDTDGLPPALASIVRRSMSPNPADRYPDAAAFRDALVASEASVDPFAATVVVPLAVPAVDPVAASGVRPMAVAGGAPVAGVGPVAGPGADRPARSSRLRLDLSPVDRAAAVFVGGVGALTLAALVVLGLGGMGGTEPSPDPPAPAVQVAPSPIDAAVTPEPDEEGNGRGRGNGNGNGDDKGKGKGNSGGD